MLSDDGIRIGPRGALGLVLTLEGGGFELAQNCAKVPLDLMTPLGCVKS